MYTSGSILSLTLVLSSLILSAQANSLGKTQSIEVFEKTKTGGNKDDEVDEYSDFEDDADDYSNIIRTTVGFDEEKASSVTHLHRDRGEILVSCFGMWWPVGGASYDYVGDYYGDYKKKKRRSRKQKKGAKMKKKKM